MPSFVATSLSAMISHWIAGDVISSAGRSTCHSYVILCFRSLSACHSHLTPLPIVFSVESLWLAGWRVKAHQCYQPETDSGRLEDYRSCPSFVLTAQFPQHNPTCLHAVNGHLVIRVTPNYLYVRNDSTLDVAKNCPCEHCVHKFLQFFMQHITKTSRWLVNSLIRFSLDSSRSYRLLSMFLICRTSAVRLCWILRKIQVVFIGNTVDSLLCP